MTLLPPGLPRWRAAAFLAFAASLLPLAAAAQEEAGAWLSPVLGRQPVTASLETVGYRSRSVEGQGTDLGLQRHELRLSAPLAQDAAGEWTAGARAGLERLSTGARLPDSGDRLPAELWDLRLGLTHRRTAGAGRIAGGNLTVASPSDAPFSGWDQTALSATAFLRIPSGERDAWLLSLNYSNARGFLDGWPLPGLGYAWSPDDRVRAVIGLPFAFVDARPLEGGQLQLAALPNALRVRATWRFFESLRAYGALAWGGREYLRRGRDDDRDRLRLWETAAEGGFRFDASPQVTLDLFGGYAWNRFLWEGRRFSDRRENRLDVADAPFAGVRVGARF